MVNGEEWEERVMDCSPLPTTTAGNARFFTDAQAAVAEVQRIYDANTGYLRTCFDRLVRGEDLPEHASACYPYVAITIQNHPNRLDTRLSFGFVAGLGRYSTTLTRPDIFARYYTEQFEHLLRNHQAALEVGVSDTPIPVHFVFQTGSHLEGALTPEKVEVLRRVFDQPDLSVMDDSIANGTWKRDEHQDHPLALFTAPRVDYSLLRLRHYTGTDAKHFQRFVIFTNYQFYIDEFVRLGQNLVDQDPNLRPYEQLISPELSMGKNGRPGTLPQMPAYHLTRGDQGGISIINIGVGPSNARNISDHVAVLRPNAWLMLGHCAGLRKTQKLGDYVLAHGYVRDDHALDKELPVWVPVPPLAEVQLALQKAVAQVTHLEGYDLKSIMRTGTVVTTDNRNWEISGYEGLVERFNQSRAIALDMESAVIAANGFRFRVPYGTLLCVSDRPLHGEIKLPGMANHFYSQQVNQHLSIGMMTMEILYAQGVESLHSRKLRSFAETAFQ